MQVQFSGIYKIMPVLSDNKRSMVGAEDVQQLVQATIDQVYLGQRPRATSFVVDGEVVMVADDSNGQDYTRFLTRQSQLMDRLSEPLKRWFKPQSGTEDITSGSLMDADDSKGADTLSLSPAEGYMPVHRLPFMLPDPGERTPVLVNALAAVQREFLDKATTVPLFVRVVNRRATEVGVEHPQSGDDQGETWKFSPKPRSRGFLSIFG